MAMFAKTAVAAEEVINFAGSGSKTKAACLDVCSDILAD